MRGPYDWLVPGDMLVAYKVDLTSPDALYRLHEYSHVCFVGPPLSSPPMPGSYYNKMICISWCNTNDVIFSSRPVGRDGP